MFRKLVHFVTLTLMISVFAHGVLHADDSFSGKTDNSCHYCQLAEQNITVDESYEFKGEVSFLSLPILFPQDVNHVQNILKLFAPPRGPPGILNFIC